MTTTIAMTVAASTPGRTTRLNTSSPRAMGLAAASVGPPAFFLSIRAASWPLLLEILQLLLEKEPSTRKSGGGEGGAPQPRPDVVAVEVDDMWTSASLVLCRAAHLRMEKSCCCTEEELLPVSVSGEPSPGATL